MDSSAKNKVTRRNFIAVAGAGAAAVAVGAPSGSAEILSAGTTRAVTQPEDEGAKMKSKAGAISEQSIAEAQKLAGLDFTEKEHQSALSGLQRAAESFRKRREDRQFANGLAPAHVFDPRLPGMTFPDEESAFVRSQIAPTQLPPTDIDIAYAPVTHLARWIESGQLSSIRLTKIYLERLKRIGPKLESVITITEDLALSQAKKADAEMAGGIYRGPLHGIPWGAKDLFDTAGIATTWGAKPYQDRVAESDAAVVRKLNQAGAVLIAKTTLGALAYGDIWFGGRTNNPFNLSQGSSGSSAGSAAGTSAGLFGFSLGTETLGSIVSPSMRCGATGLRPTFGRVPRTGAMALCWSLDKVGPICRTAEDCILVLDAIRGSDPGDAASVEMPLQFDASQSVKGLRVGYDPAWFKGRQATDIDRAAFEAAKKVGLDLVPFELPDWSFGQLMTILNVEAAAAFEELTLSNRDDELVWQDPQAWPNSFRQSWFVPAIELIQAERFRRQVCAMMAEKMQGLDALIGPSFAGSMLLITNNTGHPSLTIRAGFRSNNRPHGFTIWGNLFDEGTICRIGMALEAELAVWQQQPDLG